MSRNNATPTGRERFFDPGEVIVTKTDLKGRITYGNRVFLRMAGYDEREILGAPHNIIRHPAMPACVFKLLWDTLGAGQEIFAYVNNLSKNGDHYWVFAHVTPSFTADGTVTGYHSSRRVPTREALRAVEPLYAQLLAEERRHASYKDGMQAATTLLLDILKSHGTSYDRFVFSL